MIRLLTGRLLTVAAIAFFASATLAQAAVVFEAEVDDTAVNNTLGSAQVISGASFTTPVPPTVFDPPGYPTATIQGNGIGSGDVDFYSFSTLGGQALFDIDNDPFEDDPILSLFNSSGTLIAYNDDSFPEDPGTAFGYDSFIGAITLSAGTYYIAVSTYSNFATAAGTGSESPLTRPDGEFGGLAVTGATPGDSSFALSDLQSGEAYTLHISVENVVSGVVPEPASLTLWGLAALGCAVGAYRRRKLMC
jgi:hypothetical protein